MILEPNYSEYECKIDGIENKIKLLELEYNAVNKKSDF